MYKIKIFNKLPLDNSLSLKEMKGKIYGFSDNWFNNVQSRLEVNKNIRFWNLPLSKWIPFTKTLQKPYPKHLSVENKNIANVFLLDLLGTYKGWRHLKGLPVRGQRTWTNGWSAYRSNMLLRQFKIKISKKIYGKLPQSEMNTAYLAEQINLLWKVQWELEWKQAKKQRVQSLKKGNTPKADISNMAKGQIVSPEKFKKMNKKQKQSIKKNTYSLGFDLGFTKKIVDQLYKTNLDAQKTRKKKKISIFEDDKKNLKKKKRKKVDIKSKKIKHAIKKKSKKSVWD